MSERSYFVARTKLGVPIRTFETRDQAVGWWEDPREGAVQFPECVIAAVTEVTVTRERVIRRDRAHPQGVAA